MIEVEPAAEAHEDEGPVVLDPETMTADEIEETWYRRVYQGDDMPQLTVRAVVMGSILGMLMSLSNLYVGLKTGWGLGVCITACIMSFAIWKTLRAVFPKLTPMSILENNCMQSTASSAGYSTGGTMVSAIAAYLIVTHHQIPWPMLMLWTVFLAALGVFLAIPMKRQMVNIEQLRFPTGTAAAETLRSLHSEGDEAIAKARALGIAAVAGACIAWFRDASALVVRGMKFKFWPSIPSMLNFPGVLSGIRLAKWTVYWDMSALMIAAGAIIGWKVTWSMMLGASLNYFVLAPWMVARGDISAAHIGYRSIVAWSTWAGASVMVTSGLFTFAMQWRTVLRAMRGLGSLFTRTKVAADDLLARIEVPSEWFVAGAGISGLGCAVLLHYEFGCTWWMGAVAVVMSFFLAIVACRATGESDITPIGAMGKIVQLTFGVLAPSNMVTNLMTANVTAGAATSSADLLTDLKSGYLLGANPRQQFLAQFLGIFAGTLIVVPAFNLLVPNASVLGTNQWPAPAAQVWAKVAELLSHGVGSLLPSERWGLLIGGLVGILLPALEMWLPKAWRRFVPSAMGMGIAFVIPWFNSFSMFVGAAGVEVLKKFKPKVAEDYVVPVSSGVIAGESLMGILVALLTVAGFIPS